MKSLGISSSQLIILRHILLSLILISVFCLVLFGLRILVTGTARYGFIPVNILLAWSIVPLTGWLIVRLNKRPLLSWQTILAGLCWLWFLPNSWYVLTDFIHLNPNGEISALFDIILLFSLGIFGFTIGLGSLYMVHQTLLNRMKSSRFVHALIAGVILLSSFAIYLGRDLRWNSWDMIVRPADILVDISDRLVDPLSYPRTFSVTLLFFIFISLVYVCCRWVLAISSVRIKR